MKHKPIPKHIRKLVYDKYNGHCAYCGIPLEYKDMQVDHIKSVFWESIDNGGVDNPDITQCDDIDNLMPSCRMCNFYKGVYDIEGFRRKFTELLIPNMRKPFDYRLALRYGLIEENIKPITFYFENENNKD